jgi:hypothetical protein
MEYALLLLIAMVLGGGVAGALVTTWRLHQRTFRLEVRLNAVEETVTRQDKVAAAKVRWSKAEVQAKELVEAMKGQKPVSDPVNPWAFPM